MKDWEGPLAGVLFLVLFLVSFHGPRNDWNANRTWDCQPCTAIQPPKLPEPGVLWWREYPKVCRPCSEAKTWMEKMHCPPKGDK